MQAKDWFEKDQKYIWHSMRGYNDKHDKLIIKSADGAWIEDINGTKFLDAMSGFWCVNVGYGRKELADAAHEQLREMPYYPLTQSHLPAIKLAEN